MLSTDFELNLCEKYLFKYDEIIQDLIKCLDDTNSNLSLQINIKLVKLFKFLEETAHQFSKYYSKVHVLEVISIILRVIFKILYYKH